MHRDLFDLELQILILILPKERTFSLLKKKKKKKKKKKRHTMISVHYYLCLTKDLNGVLAFTANR